MTVRLWAFFCLLVGLVLMFLSHHGFAIQDNPEWTLYESWVQVWPTASGIMGGILSVMSFVFLILVSIPPLSGD